jgi:hypothetical protein
MIHGKHRGIHM